MFTPIDLARSTSRSWARNSVPTSTLNWSTSRSTATRPMVRRRPRSSASPRWHPDLPGPGRAWIRFRKIGRNSTVMLMSENEALTILATAGVPADAVPRCTFRKGIHAADAEHQQPAAHVAGHSHPRLDPGRQDHPHRRGAGVHSVDGHAAAHRVREDRVSADPGRVREHHHRLRQRLHGRSPGQLRRGRWVADLLAPPGCQGIIVTTREQM
jgi:hypothetical protein